MTSSSSTPSARPSDGSAARWPACGPTTSPPPPCKAVVERLPGLDPGAIDEVYLGDANQAGEDNRNVARMAVLLAGLPVTIPGATVNRLCGSGLEAVIDASRAVAVGDADIVVAGGVESMTRAPWVLLKPAKGYPTGHEQLWSTTLGWRMVNPRMPTEWTIALGEGAEVLADKYSISREEQDAFALGSHQRAAAAWDAGWFDAEVVPCRRRLARAGRVHPAGHDRSRSSAALQAGVPLGRHGDRRELVADERRRGGAAAGLARPGAARAGAHRCSPASWPGDQRRRAAPLRHRAGRGGPHRARRGPASAGATWPRSSSTRPSRPRAWPAWPSGPSSTRSIVNPQGGAIAIGHPLGCSGARILTTLVHHLRRTGGRYGMAAMCIGVGQGIAVSRREHPKEAVRERRTSPRPSTWREVRPRSTAPPTRGPSRSPRAAVKHLHAFVAGGRA